MKKCPYCAEEIQAEAIKCKHCGEFLDGSRTAFPPPLPPRGSLLPWYSRTSFIVIMLLSIGPLALPLVWLRPKLSKQNKILITIATIAITLALYFLMKFLTTWLLSQAGFDSVDELLDSYRNLTIQ